MSPKYEIGYIFAKLMFFLIRHPRVFLGKDIVTGELFQVLPCLGLFCLGIFSENLITSPQSKDLGFELGS